MYGEKIEWSGPQYASHAIKDNQVMVQFQHAGGLKTADGGPAVKDFAIADETRHWQWAEARIEGNQVILSHPSMQKPVAVRYAWANNPEVNLTNATGLPAAPFRTDDWPVGPANAQER